MGTKKVEIQKQKVLNSFPLEYGEGIILNLLSNNINVEYDEKKKSRKYFIHLIDNYGYKYYLNYHQTMSSKKTYNTPNRFFYGNPYTYENINHYCKENNIDLHIDGKGLPVIGYAREKLECIDSNGVIHKITWNQIQHYTFQYQDGYDEVKKKNYEESHMTKEKAIPIIIEKYNELKRPLLQRDFEGVNTTDTTIGIRVIWRLWGTFTNMVKELGLPNHDYYFKPFDKNYIPHDEIIKSIQDVCNKVKSEGRNIVMVSDFNNYTSSEISTIKRHCELDGTTLKDILKSYGCELQRCGNGMNHKFDDGERTVSRYEYDFSMFLRNNGFEYGKDYFRNIYYKKLDDKYTGNMNCDYKLILDGHEIYIELAGILGNPEHMKAYRSNTVIKSKSKEEYRQKLNQKREMFERNGLEYYILLKDEMNETTYKNILKKYLKEVA